MTKEEFYAIATPEKMLNISKHLDDEERDLFKYKISRICNEQLINEFDINEDVIERERLDVGLKALSIIQPYSNRIPEYGIAYKGRPKFLTGQMLKELQKESRAFRKKAVINIDQYISCVDTPEKNSHAEQLEDMPELLTLVEKYAGPVLPSYISNYIYYDQEGHCSKPHVDNGFTSITVMLSLIHENPVKLSFSKSVAYWPEKPRMDYSLAPGELSIFFGAGTLHGRTPVVENEKVHSLLLSFRPKIK